MKKVMNLAKWFYIIGIGLIFASCKTPALVQIPSAKPIPIYYTNSTDTSNAAQIHWSDFFADKKLVALIDTAIQHNLDVLITLQEIEVAKNKVRYVNGRLLPSITAGAGLGFDKVGTYTSQGAGDASADITPGNRVPEILGDQRLGFQASWEADIWGKLKNEKKAAFSRYLETVEGKNLVVTSLVAEVANTYFELLALHNQLNIINETIQLQKNGLEIVRFQKEANVVTELAVKQFEAQLYNAQNLEFNVLQNITESENKLNFLLGRYPQKIEIDTTIFVQSLPTVVKAGIPSQLLENRPDIKQAELELNATKCDLNAVKAEFYPSLNIGATLGVNAFKSNYLFRTPESIIYSFMGDLSGPLVNKSAIIAAFKTANAFQIEAMYNYQKTILNGFVEVSNQLSNIQNLEQSYLIKSKEVTSLNKSIEVSNDLFKSAKANYLEVLMTQKDALASKLELIEVRKQQFNAITNIYKSLGGGWK